MKILDILPLNYALHAPHFRSRYEGMPNDYSFHLLVTGDTAYDGETFANATLHVQAPAKPGSSSLKIWKALSLIHRAVCLARREKIDVVISYDPLTLGLVGAMVKLFTGARLVVEVNGHLRDAKDARLAGQNVGWVKRKLFTAVGTISLSFADCVKILNRDQYAEWRSILNKKRVVMSHNYIPTSRFKASERDDHFILCIGFPYHRKGVDVLLDAFGRIQPDYPEYRLVIMGYCPEPELSLWKERANGIANVEFRKPVVYDRINEYFAACSALVTPSRSEGMGRVFIEAMASGKPCVGTRVGGIPNVIADGRSGFLVEPENAVELADKLRLLLADPDLRVRMGREGKRIADTVLSDKKYVVNFRRMIELVQDDGPFEEGIAFNGFTDE